MFKILSLRDGQEFGSTSVRPFVLPKLNWDAQSIRDIQDWLGVTELLLTASIAHELRCTALRFASPIHLLVHLLEGYVF